MTNEEAISVLRAIPLQSAVQAEALDLAISALRDTGRVEAALSEAVCLIEFYHGPAAWTEYQSSPEMKRIRSALDNLRAAVEKGR